MHTALPVICDPAGIGEALGNQILAGGKSPSEVARELEINPSTVRMWKSRAKQGGRATAADVPSKPAADRAAIDPAKGARSTWHVAERATRKALELLDKGDTLGAQRAMITAGIAADKTGQLSEAAERAEERAARLNEGQALKIAELLTAWCKALGIPLTASVSAVGRELLERAGREDVLVVSPVLAEPAAAEIRERMRTQLREEIEAHLRAEPHGLPAARAEENKSLLAALPTQQITRATPSSS